MSEDENQPIRDVVKGAGVVYGGLFLELLIALVAQIIAANYLSVSEFGGLTTGTALLDIGAIVAGLGFASGLRRYLPRVSDGEKRMLSLLTGAVTAVTSLVLGVGVSLNASFIAAEVFNDQSVTVSIRIFGAAIPFAALFNLAVGGLRGNKESLYPVYVQNIAHPVSRFLLIAGAVVLGLGQAGIALAYALPYVVSAFLGLLLLHRALPAARTAIDSDLTEQVTRYSIPFTLSGISGFVYRSIDIFLILNMIGSAAVGVYGVAYAAVSFMGMLSTAFNFIGAPVASELEKESGQKDVLDLFRLLSRWLVIGSVCLLVPLALFPEEFIIVIYGAKYQDGGIVLTILAIGFAIKNVMSVHGPILESLGRSKTISINSTAAAVSNLLFNLVLIPRYGITGAAIATVGSFLLRDVLAFVEVRVALGTSPLSWQTLRPLLIGTPFLAVYIAVVKPIVPTTFLWLVGLTGLFGVLYVSSVLLLSGLSEKEIMIVRSAEERYGIPLGPADAVIEYLSNR